MEIKQFSEQLLTKMKGHVEQITLEQQDVLLRTSQIISAIEAFIAELKQYVVKYKFLSAGEEIDFFKAIKPVFISQLWFHKRLFKIHLFESFNDVESRLNYYYKCLKSLQEFMVKHDKFYHYILSNSVHMDEKYFVRINSSKQSFIHDDRFSTGYDNRLSKILAHELIKDFIFNSIQKLKNPSEFINAPLSWTGSKTDLIELIYALQGSGVFNQSSADVKQIANYFQNVFNINLGNYYRTFQEIKLRKGGQTNFLDTMKKKLVHYIEQAEL